MQMKQIKDFDWQLLPTILKKEKQSKELNFLLDEYKANN